MRKWYKDNSVWADNDTAKDFKKILDTPYCRMYSGRRMSRIINKSHIRNVIYNSKQTLISNK